jgi:hypothetical protein
VFLPPEEPILQYLECQYPEIRTPRWAMPRKVAALMMYDDRIRTLSCGCNYDTPTGVCTAQCRRHATCRLLVHRIFEAVRLLNEVLREEAGESDGSDIDPEWTPGRGTEG